MNTRYLALGATLTLLSGCGVPAVPTHVSLNKSQTLTRAQQLRTLQWSGTADTATKNLIQFSLVSAHAENQGIKANLHLLYGDRTSVFAGRSTLMAQVRLTTSQGPKEFRNVPMQLAKEVNGVRYFAAQVAVPMGDSAGDVDGLELSFVSADRYGHLISDSADGLNYRFTRAR
jgi:hypothetical protein